MPVLPRAAFVASSAGASTILARTALGHPPGWLELGTLFGWFALSTTGVFFPSLEMYGSIVSRGPQGRGQVALTFDDGPHPETTRAVLEALSGTAHRATFFVLGDKARRHPDVVREIHEAGHSLGVHGDFHDRLHSFRHPTRVRRELEAARASVERATGVRPRIFRPPLGHTTPLTVFGARRAGMTIVGWSARAYDGLRGSRPEDVLARLRPGLTDGAIVLLHDAAERDDFTPASIPVLPTLLHWLDERGLTSVGLDTWFGE
ncbi:MAG TPA: polysaccharide deacetylase family protein [Polyangiaceae bacterium]|nr:polysaccharide deacetylase family protein [Polyangiaceae bacterium]